MSPRALTIMAALVAVLAAALWWVQRPAEVPVDARVQTPLLPGLADNLNAVERVKVRIDGGELLADLVRRNDDWWVANRSDHRASTSTLRRILVDLADAVHLEPRTDNPADYFRLGVDDVEAGNPDGIEITLEGAGAPATVIVGRTSADGRGSYIRRSGEAQGWLVSGPIERPRRIGDWLDSRIVDLPPGEIRWARIEPLEGTPIVIRSDQPGAADFDVLDVPPGHQLLTPRMGRSLARFVAELELEDVVPADEAPPLSPTGRARYETWDGLVVEIHAWHRDDTGADGFVTLRAQAVEPAAEARAAALNGRWEDWVYRIPEYKYVNATSSLERITEIPLH